MIRHHFPFFRPNSYWKTPVTSGNLFVRRAVNAASGIRPANLPSGITYNTKLATQDVDHVFWSVPQKQNAQNDVIWEFGYLSAHKPHLRPLEKGHGSAGSDEMAHSTPDSDDADEEKNQIPAESL